MAILIFCAIGAALCGLLAPAKNRSAVGWGIIGFLMPLLGLILLVVLPEVEENMPAKKNPRLAETLKTVP